MEEPPRLKWHRADIAGRTVRYGDAGDGPAVVFLHGWGLSGRSYAKALPTIAAAGSRVLAPALPGFGKSEPLEGTYTFDALAQWLSHVLDSIEVTEPIALVGHSFGGAIATSFAWHYPDRVRSLVLVNALGGSVWKEGRSGNRSLAERPIWDWGLRVPAEFRKRHYRRVLPVVLRDLVSNALANPRAVARAAKLARNTDLRRELASLAERGLPVSILWGSEDNVVPEATYLAMCDAAGAPGDIVENAGHLWLLADPEGFGDLVTNSTAIQQTLNDHLRERNKRP